MPFYPQNFTHAAPAPSGHAAPRDLTPIAEAPASASIEEAQNPSALFNELHEAIMVQERSGYSLSWNSMEEDDLPSGAVPPFLPRTEPLDTFPPYSPTLQLMLRVDRPGGSIDASSPPPLERHGGNFPPCSHDSHQDAAAHAPRSPFASFFSNIRLPLEHSHGSWGALVPPWPATMTDGTPTMNDGTPTMNDGIAQAMGVTPHGEDDSDDMVELLGAIDRGPFMSE